MCQPVMLDRQQGPFVIGRGIFGAVVTIGLFMYELRQIDVCRQLRNHAAWIESQMGIRAGRFGRRRERLSLSNLWHSALKAG